MLRKSSTLYVLLLLFAVTSNSSLDAQPVSNPSGFYPVDSLFFTVTQAPPKGGKIQISVNCFTTASCFSDYKGGVWLYNRNNTPNTWEDQQFSRAPTEAVDTLAHRGKLDKVNVVRVRAINAKGEIESDDAYFVGVTGGGTRYPYTLPVVQLLVDSLDAFGPEGFYAPGQGIRNQFVNSWNYDLDQSAIYNSYVPRSRVEKTCIMQILDRDNPSLLYQKCGIHTTGFQPRSMPDKCIEVEARAEYSGTTTFSTSLLSNTKEDLHSLRFMAGGGGFILHEIGESIAAGLNVGDVRVRPVITFLNGSYWSVSYMQPDVELDMPRDIKQPEKASIFKPLYFVKSTKLLNTLRDIKVDTKNIVWANVPGTNEVIGTGLIEKGTKDLFQPVCERLLGSLGSKGTPLSFAEIDGMVDLNSWLTYIALVDFGRIRNSLGHHVFMGTAPGKKLFLLTEDLNDFAGESVTGNNWKEHILPANAETEDKTFESVLIREILLKNKGCIEKLCLRYEDLLNTAFKPERTTAIIEKVGKEVLPEYEKSWKSWTPNAGPDIDGQRTTIEGVKNFCSVRPEIVWQQLADQWLPDSKYHLTDRKLLSVVLDSVPAGTAKVHVNSLEITRNWVGAYYPSPAPEVSMEAVNVPAGFVLVWKEYADKPLSFKIPLQSEVTLTPVLRKANK